MEQTPKNSAPPVRQRPEAAPWREIRYKPGLSVVNRTWLVTLSALAGLSLSVPTLVSSARADGITSRPDILPTSEIKKGMKGYGLTVFEGTRPERFDVEVIDVLENFRPRQELILIKTMHPRLDVTKIVAGMSGSPIFIQGKMVGAYAYGWTFGTEPVAGVTPIRAMLDDLVRPLPRVLRGTPLHFLPEPRRNVARGERASARVDYDLRQHAHDIARSLAKGETAATPVSTPLLLSGVSESALAMARDLLEPMGLVPLQAGGAARASSKNFGEGYVDGGAIGVSLVRGDVSGLGLGTVTRVEGDRLVAFGHPMMGVGVTALPTCEARVLWFMASQQRSFKMGEAGPLRGTLVNDRQASIVVHADARPRLVPVKLRIEGEPGAPFSNWSFEVAHDRFVTPAFLGMAIGSGLEAAAAERRDVTYLLRTKVKFAGFSELSFEDFGSSPTGTPGTSELMDADFLRAVGAAFSNPWQDVALESIDVVAELRFAREVATLRGLELLTPEIEPGGTARLRVYFEPYAGPRQSRELSVTLPAELTDQKVTLDVRPGYEVDRPLAPPENLAELLVNLQHPTETPRSLVISYDSGQTSAAYRGVVASELPPGALDRLTSTSSSLGVTRFKSERHQVHPLPFYVIGKDQVTVQVKKALR